MVDMALARVRYVTISLKVITISSGDFAHQAVDPVLGTIGYLEKLVLHYWRSGP